MLAALCSGVAVRFDEAPHGGSDKPTNWATVIFQGIFSLMTERLNDLFITHAWRYHDDWTRLGGWRDDHPALDTAAAV